MTTTFGIGEAARSDGAISVNVFVNQSDQYVVNYVEDHPRDGAGRLVLLDIGSRGPFVEKLSANLAAASALVEVLFVEGLSAFARCSGLWSRGPVRKVSHGRT